MMYMKKNINKNAKEDLMDYSIIGIIEAEDIDDNVFKKYLDKQNKNISSEAEKYAIEKYIYKKNWNIKVIDQDFMNQWFRKTHILDNIRLLKGEQNNQILSYDKFSKNNYLVYDKAKQKESLDIIKN